ncbi:hypothetical protein GCM10017687_05810 [Streptomyces echinatus]
MVLTDSEAAGWNRLLTTTWNSTSLLPDILASWWEAAPSSTAASLTPQFRRHPLDGDRQRGRAQQRVGEQPARVGRREFRRRGVQEDPPGAGGQPLAPVLPGRLVPAPAERRRLDRRGLKRLQGGAGRQQRLGGLPRFDQLQVAEHPALPPQVHRGVRGRQHQPVDQPLALHEPDPERPLPRVVEGAPRQLLHQGLTDRRGLGRGARADPRRQLARPVDDLFQTVLAVRQEPGAQAVVHPEQLRQVREHAGGGAGRGEGEVEPQVVPGGVVTEPRDDTPDRPLPPGGRAGPGPRGVQSDGPLLDRGHRVSEPFLALPRTPSAGIGPDTPRRLGSFVWIGPDRAGAGRGAGPRVRRDPGEGR